MQEKGRRKTARETPQAFTLDPCPTHGNHGGEKDGDSGSLTKRGEARSEYTLQRALCPRCGSWKAR